MVHIPFVTNRRIRRGEEMWRVGQAELQAARLGKREDWAEASARAYNKIWDAELLKAGKRPLDPENR